jgi:hypothetical protein
MLVRMNGLVKRSGVWQYRREVVHLKQLLALAHVAHNSMRSPDDHSQGGQEALGVADVGVEGVPMSSAARRRVA